MSLGIVFGRKTPANHTFQDGQSLILWQIDLFPEGDVTHVPLEGNPSVLEAEASNILFVCEN